MAMVMKVASSFLRLRGPGQRSERQFAGRADCERGGAPTGRWLAAGEQRLISPAKMLAALPRAVPITRCIVRPGSY